MQLSNVQLEVSLKPFKALFEEGLRAVCRTLFEQWLPLCRTSRQVSVLLWVADGSEILDYQGDLGAEFEWAKWVGVANPRAEKPKGPKGEAVHHSPRLYIEQPPSWTYGDLKRLIGLLKEVGAEVTGLPVRVGATFDPGPEFAVSSFKYERHPELCPGETMGKGSFAVCYATLHGDHRKYATFPEGIPEGTPFGTFLGRQARCFMEELGYDYLWLSNGFGFGLEPWGLRGAVFNGKKFFPERAEAVKEGSLAFWMALRDELGDLPLATRGTNLSTGMDLASDGVPLRELYAGGFNFEPPPNSPWAALNGDFGLELIGWMSHIAELPGRDYPFRFYIHDPWFLNSPWLDRYGRQPHDIYLPLAVSRIDAAGEVSTPNSQLLLTVDDSHGELPDQVPQEVLPHLLDAWRTAPDEPGPLVWVYPFAEYHEWTFGSPDRIKEVFFGDWFMRGAVNAGLPLNTVISTTSLPSALGRLAESLLVSPVPDAGSAWEEALLGHVIRGGKALLYGPLGHAGPELLEALRVDLTAPLEGDFELALACEQDLTETMPFPTRLAHSAFLSGGGLEAEPREGAAPPFAASTQDGAQRVAATLAQVGEGTLAWVRGTVACDPERTTGHLLVPLEAERFFPAEILMRYALAQLGIQLFADRDSPRQRPPLVTISRNQGAWYFAGYNPDTTVGLRLRLPEGAPLFIGCETRLVEGRTAHCLPRAWRHECRVFISEQPSGLLSCVEQFAGEVGIRRRLRITGLENATVRFFPVPGTEAEVQLLRSPVHPYMEGDFLTPEREGKALLARNVTGELLISW